MSNPERYAVAVIMQRTLVKRGPWSVPSWSAVSIVEGEQATGRPPGCHSIREGNEDGDELFLWTGLVLELYRDLAEEYWYNLTSESPMLFVICHETPDGELTPFKVTADHDSSSVCLESDDQVFALPIPAGLYQHLERFVVNNFVPRERKRRKRKNWLPEQER